MLKKTVSALLALLVMNLGIFAFVPTNNESKELKFANKVKSEIARLGTGTDAKIKVKLKDGTKLKGYVTESNDTEFIVADAKTGKLIPVSYSQVQTTKGNNLSKGVIITIAGIGVIILIAVLAASSK